MSIFKSLFILACLVATVWCQSSEKLDTTPSSGSLIGLFHRHNRSTTPTPYNMAEGSTESFARLARRRRSIDELASTESPQDPSINLEDEPASTESPQDPSIDLDEEADNVTSPKPWYHDIFGLDQEQEEASTGETLDRVLRDAEETDSSTTSSEDQDVDLDGIDDLREANKTESNGTDPFNFASTAPTSTFDCKGRKFGYYADVGRNCTIYHLCNPVTLPDTPELVYQRISFLCLQNSTFDQMTLSCTRTPQMACAVAPDYYESSNLSIRRSASTFHGTNDMGSDDAASDSDDEDEDDDNETEATTSHGGLMSMLFQHRRRK